MDNTNIYTTRKIMLLLYVPDQDSLSFRVQHFSDMVKTDSQKYLRKTKLILFSTRELV